ncbi:polyketide synthase dehydratase domain-containing protein [Streptomyces lydicus]|nr:polyketide synthase dehydratase domain-containing protein [Streptomyces lydicus]
MAVDTLYQRLAESGLDYGTVFQGMRAAWRAGDDIFAEVVLPDTARQDAERSGIHPAALDAVLHSLALGGNAEGPRGSRSSGPV